MIPRELTSVQPRCATCGDRLPLRVTHVCTACGAIAHPRCGTVLALGEDNRPFLCAACAWTWGHRG